MDPNMHHTIFTIWHLCVLILVTQKLQVVYGYCTYWMTKMSIFCVRAGCEIQLASYGSKHVSQSLSSKPSVQLCILTHKSCKRDPTGELQPQTCISHSLIQIVCVYCKPIDTFLFGLQLCMTTKLAYLVTAYYTLNNGFTANDASFLHV